MRNFRLTEGRHNKYWRIALSTSRCKYIVHFGRVGTAGLWQTKTFLSVTAAMKAHEKIVSQKCGKGYREVSFRECGAPLETEEAPSLTAGEHVSPRGGSSISPPHEPPAVGTNPGRRRLILPPKGSNE